MIDLDFVLKDKPQIKRVVIYRHETAALYHIIWRNLSKILQGRGYTPELYTGDNPLVAIHRRSLFGKQLLNIDLERLTQEKANIERMVSNLVDTHESIPNRVFLHVREDTPADKICSSDVWKQLVNSSTFIEEQCPTKTSVRRTVDIVLKENPWLQPVKEGEEVFLSSLQELVSNSEVTAVRLLRLVEMTLLVCVRNGQFDSASFRRNIYKEEEKQFFKVHSALWEGLRTDGQRNKHTLGRVLDNMIYEEGMLPRAASTRVHNALKDLLLANEFLNSDGSVPTGWSSYKWKRIRKYGGVNPSSILRCMLLLSSKERFFLNGEMAQVHKVTEKMMSI